MIEPYFLPLKDPFETIFKIRQDDRLNDNIVLSLIVPTLIIIYRILIELVVNFLHVYFLYVIFNPILQYTRVFTSRKSLQVNIKMLPKNICTKILGLDHLKVERVAIIWNAIVNDLYNNHLLSMECRKVLLYTKVCTFYRNLIYNCNTYNTYNNLLTFL